jgi:hypothetical protein
MCISIDVHDDLAYSVSHMTDRSISVSGSEVISPPHTARANDICDQIPEFSLSLRVQQHVALCYTRHLTFSAIIV